MSIGVQCIKDMLSQFENNIKSTLIYPRTGAAHIEQYVNNKQSQTHGATNALRR